MSAPFAPGDVVVRIAGTDHPMPVGATDTVVWVGEGIDERNRPCLGLVLTTFDPGFCTETGKRLDGWAAENFRKLRPNETAARDEWRKMLDAPAKQRERSPNEQISAWVRARTDPARNSRERA